MLWGRDIFIYLFTSFSGHRPAQRECARTGLRSHERCHPFPNPTTRKGWPHHRGRVLLHATRTNQGRSCETRHTVFRPYPRRLESLTIYRCHYKGSTFLSVIFKDPEYWSGRGLNARPRLPLGRPALYQLSQPGGGVFEHICQYLLFYVAQNL